MENQSPSLPMMFIKPVLVTLLLLSVPFFFWFPAGNMVQLTETESVPSSEISFSVQGDEAWQKLKIEPVEDQEKQLSPVSYFIKQKRSFIVEPYQTIQVIEGGKDFYYMAVPLSADETFSNSTIPAKFRFPYRPFALICLCLAVVIISFRKKIFKEGGLAAQTSAATGSKISIVLMVVGLSLFSLPFVYRVFNDGMGAATYAGAILFFTGLISFVIFLKATVKVNKLLENNEILAEWFVPKDEWLTFINRAAEQDVKKLIIVMTIITVFMLLCGVIIGEESALLVTLVMAAISLILWLVTLGPLLWKRYSLKKQKGCRVLVYSFGAMLGKKIHQWNLPGSSAPLASFCQKPFPAIKVEFSTVMLTNSGPIPQRLSVCIPVPQNRFEEAETVVNKINSKKIT